MSPTDFPDHPGSISYNWESSEVPLFHKPVTGQDFFLFCFLQLGGSSCSLHSTPSFEGNPLMWSQNQMFQRPWILRWKQARRHQHLMAEIWIVCLIFEGSPLMWSQNQSVPTFGIKRPWTLRWKQSSRYINIAFCKSDTSTATSSGWKMNYTPYFFR